MGDINLPNGMEFPFGERGSTSELLFEAGVDVRGVQPAIRISYDVDEVEGLYLQLAVTKALELAEVLRIVRSRLPLFH